MEFYKSLVKEDFKDAYSRALVDYDYRTFNILHDFELLNGMEKDVKFFLNRNRKAHIIPLRSFDDMTIGYVMRSATFKAFHDVKVNDKIPMVFGLHDFGNYTLNTPVLLCEGIKDCQVLKKLYPYSLAYLTSKPSEKLFQFLTNMTNRIIFFPDSDRTGNRFLYDKEMKEHFKYYKKWFTPYGKDLGKYFEGTEKTLEWLKIILKMEGLI